MSIESIKALDAHSSYFLLKRVLKLFVRKEINCIKGRDE
jgi:hypothetical protein